MSRLVTLELNRVEGDLEIDVAIEDGKVVDAWCRGTLYRGFEQLMTGRDPLDALTITPRVCGICSTSHLMAAVLALENAMHIAPPPAAVAVRNICMRAETAQSDLRQTLLMFAVDFCQEAYAGRDFYPAAQAAFGEGRGNLWLAAIEQSRQIVQIVALFGGQWPHSSFMVPGGVTTPDVRQRSLNALQRLRAVEAWAASSLFGGELEEFLALASAADLSGWLAERPESGLSLLCRCMDEAGLRHLGRGAGALLSYGCHPDPDLWSPQEMLKHRQLPAGVMDLAGGEAAPLDPGRFSEDITSSWYLDDQASRHPSAGKTVPRYLPDGQRYTWNKAPRYGGEVMQVGPIAQLAIGGDPLIRDLLALQGDSAWLRQFSRLRRLAGDLVALRRDLSGLLGLHNPRLYVSTPRPAEGVGMGLVEATRGSLGHWVSFAGNRIENYQIISPTSWNASPRDAAGRPGHWESSLIGLPVEDEDNPVVIGHVIRSHDPCLVCTVHVGGTGKEAARRRWRL